ncbi:hypothetical protein QYM36_011922, partial [Artemia franciscana]
MSQKRPVEDQSSAEESPPAKKVQFEPVQIGPVSSLEEMDMKTLQFQNKKLSQRLELRLKTEVELKQRIEQLEKRQIQDDTVLNLVNRYWNMFNEDVRIILQRFDAEVVEETDASDDESTNSFLALLSTWDRTELDEKLASRVQVSSSAVAKIIRAFERLLGSRNKLALALKGESLNESDEAPPLEESVKEMIVELQDENKKLHSLNSTLHEKNHTLALKNKELQEQLTARETETAELKNRLDDIQYEFDRIRRSNHNLEHNLADALEKLKQYQAITPCIGGSGTDDKPISKLTNYNKGKVEELVRELEEQKELSANRLAELDKLHQDYKSVLQQLEHLKMDIKQLPESVIVETTEYKCLQSQFSVLYNESMALKTQLDEARIQLNSVKNAHLRQIEQMEAEELIRQKQLRTEVITLEDMLAQVRKEYEMLRIEFEQQLAANEQTGPINREMRHLITSLQNHNLQLKGEIGRYKRKYREVAVDLSKTRKEAEETQNKITTLEQQLSAKEEEIQASSMKEERKPEVKIEGNDDPEASEQKGKIEDKLDLEHSSGDEVKKETKNEKVVLVESEIVRDLKSQLKKALADQREMKLLLDLHKGASKDMREKAQILASEKKLRQEVEELKNQIKKMQDTKREDRKKMAEEDALKKIKQLEDLAHTLQKQVAAQKLEEEALLNEMEVTGQAYEDMQEQNSRLIQQLREKDDANFKLMSERIKSQQVQKLQREEKVLLEEQVSTLGLQVEAQNQVIRRLEEKERILQNSLTLAEREVMLRQQALELHKRKAIESAQSANDLKLHLGKYDSSASKLFLYLN